MIMKYIVFMSATIFLLLMSKNTYPSGNLGSPVNISVINDKQDEITLSVDIRSYTIDSVIVNSGMLNKINLRGYPSVYTPGEPDLPLISLSLQIDNNIEPRIVFLPIDSTEIELGIAPCPQTMYRSSATSKTEYVFSNSYEVDRFLVDSIVRVSEPYIFRKIRGIDIRFMPFVYNPVKKRIKFYSKGIIKILKGYNSATKNNVIHSVETSTEFEKLYSHHFINYATKSALAKTVGLVDGKKMLIIYHDDFSSIIQQFATFKSSCGYNVNAIPLSNVGVSEEDIKDYITIYYNSNPDLVYVLLVGNHDLLPSFVYENGGMITADQKYSWIAGDDYYPDIILGRFVGSTVQEIERQVNKTIFYESQMTSGDWFHSALSIGSDCRIGHNNENDWQHLRNIDDNVLYSYYSNIFEAFDGSKGAPDLSGNPNVSYITEKVNDGVSLINYAGHGGQFGWRTSGFQSEHVDNLQNDNKLPFIYSVACWNGSFAYKTCFATKWMNAWNNSTSNPTGAIEFFGAGIEVSWDPPMLAQDEFNRMLIEGEFISYGALCINSVVLMAQMYSISSTLADWIYFGDPSVKPITSHGSCPLNLVVRNTISAGVTNYTANSNITANNIVQGSAVVSLGANSSVILLDGFWAKEGTSLTANTNGCALLTKEMEYDFSSEDLDTISHQCNGKIVLYQNIPNPFNPTTKIRFYANNTMPEHQKARVDIFSVKGDLVRSFNVKICDNKYHEINWDGRNRNNNQIANGVYIVKLSVGQHRDIIRAIYAK